MIVVYSETTKSRLIVEQVINNYTAINDEKWYLLGIGHGFDTAIFLVQALGKEDVLNEYANNEVSQNTRIDGSNLNRYLQEGRKHCLDTMNTISCHVDDIESQIDEPDFDDDDALRILDEMKETIDDLIRDLNGMRWDSDGPYADLVWIGRNTMKAYHKVEVRILEQISIDQIDFEHPKCSRLQLDNKPFKKQKKIA